MCPEVTREKLVQMIMKIQISAGNDILQIHFRGELH